MKIMLIFKNIIAVFLSVIVLYGMSVPQIAKAGADAQEDAPLVKIESLKGCKKEKASYGVARTLRMQLTAYSSRVQETDDTPFIAASGKRVFDGMIAINGLRFGTKVRIPDLYGDKIFVVEDRMNTRYGKLKRGDIWMASTQDAIEFGFKPNLTVEILEG